MSRHSVCPPAFAARSLSFFFGVTVAAIALALAAATSASAQNKFWINANGGSFGTAANWSTTQAGAGGATPPAAGENAIFTPAGAYTVSFGADVNNSALAVANGTVTLDFNSFNYTITSPVGTTVGTTAAQTAKLIIKDGILGVDTAGDDTIVGNVAGAIGTLTVSTGGRLGNGTIDPDVIVGNFGTGTLSLESNGRVDAAQLNIGLSEGSTGTVTVAGPNAVVDSSAAVVVGFSGNGTLNVQNAGTMSSATTTSIGLLLGSVGTATVSGAGSSWSQAGALTVGDAGDAGLSIQTTAQLTTGGIVTIGNAATGTGAAVVSGIDTTWNMASGLNLGVSGTGNMAATTGARITTGGATIMSNNAGSDSTILITGAGSRWTSGAITVANAGNATLTVNSGGVVNTTGNVLLATAASGTAKATVSGAGSTWNITGGLTVSSLGSTGSGTLQVDTGGILTATGTLSLLDPAGTPNSTFNFQGGTITANSFVRSATSTLNWTDGTLIVNGGSFNNGGANLVINGSDSDDAPALRLSSGATSVVSNLPNLTIGSNRQGAAIVSGGSSFQTTTTSIGSQDGGSGTLLVEGANSTFSTTGELNVAGATSTGGGIGTVTIGISGTVSVGDRLRLWNGALINMSGGTMIFNTIAANGGKFNFSSGTVQASSSLTANAAVLNAIVGPTHVLGVGQQLSVPGNSFNLQSDLTVDGGTLSGGTLSISMNVNTRVTGGGNATFTNGISNPNGARFFVTDATVNAGTTFTNLGELTLSGTTATVNATGLTNTGVVSGSGRINNVVTNNTAGQIRVAVGQRLEVLGSASSNSNDGLIDVDGGTIEFGRALFNSTVSPSSGLIAARNATLRFFGGLQNSGSMTFTSGVSDVFGDVTTLNNLSTPGRVVVTGGAQANFYDDVVNNGSIQVSGSGSLQSTAVFLGSLSGLGVSGTGHVFNEGDMRPGFSPGTMAFGGDLSYGPLATLNIEIAGTTPGTQYDRVTVANTAALDGTLKVSLLGGFKPNAGNSFQIISANGGLTGTFANEVLPALAGGLDWNLAYTAQAVTLSVGGVLGDYNLDGTVDAADYAVWRKLLDSNTLVADGNGNGIVDQPDFDVWKAHFGEVAISVPPVNASAATVAVPEPATLVLASFSAALAFALSFRKRR